MRAGLWIRVSTDQQAESESPDVHRQRCQMYADFKGWDVVEIYNLSGVSGKSVLEHPEAKRMLEDVRSGHIESLIFSKLARLARNVSELLEISTIFKKHGAALVSLGESIDTSTPAGQLMYTIIGALAEWEREEISARVAASVPIRARQGRPTGGKAPWGYVWVENGDSKKLEVKNESADVIKRIFDICLELDGNISRTVKKCNALGITTREGYKWRVTSMSRLLSNPIYSGKRRANYSKSTGDGKHWVEKPREEWVYHDVEPIIDEITWNKVQSIRAVRSGPFVGITPPKESTTMYGGMLVCGCDRKTKMYRNHINTDGDTIYRCKKCRRKIKESEIDKFVEESISKLSVNQDILNKPQVDTKKIRKEIEKILREAEMATEKKKKLLGLFTDDGIDKNTLRESFAEQDALHQNLVEEAQRLQFIIDTQDRESINFKTLIDSIKKVDWMLDNASRERKRSIIRGIIDKIYVDKDTINITIWSQIMNESHMGMGVKQNHNFSIEVELQTLKEITKPTTIGAMIKHERESTGWTQKDLAIWLGVAPRTVMLWEQESGIQKRYRKKVDYFLSTALK